MLPFLEREANQRTFLSPSSLFLFQVHGLGLVCWRELMHTLCAAVAWTPTADHGVIYDADRWLRGAG